MSHISEPFWVSPPIPHGRRWRDCRFCYCFKFGYEYGSDEVSSDAFLWCVESSKSRSPQLNTRGAFYDQDVFICFESAYLACTSLLRLKTSPLSFVLLLFIFLVSVRTRFRRQKGIICRENRTRARSSRHSYNEYKRNIEYRKFGKVPNNKWKI